MGDENKKEKSESDLSDISSKNLEIIVEAADNEEKKESTSNEVIDSKEATTTGEKVEVVQKEITIVDNKKSRENKVDQDGSSSPNSQSPNFSSEKDSKETTG